MYKAKRYIVLLLALVMVVSLFAACGGQTQSTSSAPAGAESPQAQTEIPADEGSQPAGSGEKPLINIFTLYSPSNSDAGAAYFLAAVEKAKEKYPDYEIVHETADVETYKTKIKAMMAANEAPDIFFAWGAGFVQPFVEQGRVMALDEFLDEDTKSRMLPGTSTEFIFDGKQYGLTSYKWIGALYCNKEMFDQYSLKIPETYEELMTACKTFRENGIDPMAVGMKDKWPGQQYINMFSIQVAGADKVQQMVNKELPFDDPSLVEAVQLTKDLIDAEAFNTGALGLTRDESEMAFLQGNVPMNFTGSWFSELVSGESSLVDGKIVVTKFPMAENTIDDTQYFGGAINGLCVSAEPAFPNETVEVCKFLAEQSAIEDGGLVTWNVPDEALETVHPLNKDIIDMTKDATTYSLAWDTLLSSADAQEWLNLVAELFNGDLSAEDFCSRLQQSIGA